jgi:hypothetical protein
MRRGNHTHWSGAIEMRLAATFRGLFWNGLVIRDLQILLATQIFVEFCVNFRQDMNHFDDGRVPR